MVTAMIVLLMLATAAPASTGWRSIMTTPGFLGLRVLLRHRADAHGIIGANHVCVIARRDRDARDRHGSVTTAFAYWRERQRIDLIGPTRDAALSDASVGPGSIDLTRDIIGEHGQTGLSPSAVTRAQADEIIRRCGARGLHLIFMRGGKAR